VNTETIKLSRGCWLEANTYDSLPALVQIVYVERSTDYFSEDHQTDVDITPELARQIISLLERAFRCEPNSKPEP